MLLRRRVRKRSRQQVKTTLEAKWSQPQGRESLECVEFSRPIEEHASLTKEIDFEDHALKQKIEGLWKMDFCDTLVNTRSSHSVEDKRALEMMENSFVKVNGYYQVALPWRSYIHHTCMTTEN